MKQPNARALVVGLLVSAVAQPAAAQRPQASLGLLTGLGAHERARDGVSTLALRTTLRADLSFDSLPFSGPRWGGMAEVSYLSIRGARAMLGAGLYSRLEPFALIVSAGPSWDFAGGNPGAGLRLFVGSRAYSARGWYSGAGGLVLGYDYHARNHAFFASLQVDVAWLALPFLGIASWLSGRPDADFADHQSRAPRRGRW